MMITTIQKWGNSQGIRLPRYILDAVQFSADEEVEIDVADGKIIIKKAAEKRKSIRELFEGYEGEYGEQEVDWGKPAGKEVW